MSTKLWLFAAALATGMLVSGCSSANAPSVQTASAASPSGPTDAEKAAHLAAAQHEVSLGAAAYEAEDWYGTKDHYFTAYLEYARAGLRSDPAVRECQVRASEAVRVVRLGRLR